jgi:hypothetical protein
MRSNSITFNEILHLDTMFTFRIVIYILSDNCAHLNEWDMSDKRPYKNVYPVYNNGDGKEDKR